MSVQYTNSVATNLAAITLTPTAENAGFAVGLNLAGLMANASEKLVELNLLLTQIMKIHPQSGPDAANFAALQAVAAELYP